MAKKVIREEIDIFGGAREKGATKKDTKSDKPTVEVKGLEEKLLSMEYLKSEIADLEGQLKTVTDEIKEVSKEKYIELYEQAGRNPNTFIIRDGNGCVMVLPTDRYIKVADRARAEELQERYGEDAVEIEEKFVFDNDVLQRNLATIQSLIANSNLSDSDKRALVYKEVKFNVAKGFIDRINEFEDMEGVLNDVQPVIALKNCGGKMEEGGEMADNYIGYVYDEYESGGSIDYDKVRMADEIYREHNRERISKGIENFSKESVDLWNEKYDDRLNRLNLTYEEKGELNPKNWYESGGGVGNYISNIFSKKNKLKVGDILITQKGLPMKNDSPYFKATAGTEIVVEYIKDGNYGIRRSFSEYANEYPIKEIEKFLEEGLLIKKQNYAKGGGVGKFDWNKAMQIANKLKVVKDRLEEARRKGDYQLVKKLEQQHEYYGRQLDDMKYESGGGVGSWTKEIEVVAISQSGTRGYEIYDTMTNRRAINSDGSYEFDDAEISEIIGEKNMDAFYGGQDKFKPKKKLNFDIFESGGGVGMEADYGSDLTDEAMVKQNLVDGVISSATLKQIIGCEPEYPVQIVGAIKLEKCFLKPYYKLA